MKQITTIIMILLAGNLLAEDNDWREILLENVPCLENYAEKAGKYEGFIHHNLMREGDINPRIVGHELFTNHRPFRAPEYEFNIVQGYVTDDLLEVAERKTVDPLVAVMVGTALWEATDDIDWPFIQLLNYQLGHSGQYDCSTQIYQSILKGLDEKAFCQNDSLFTWPELRAWVQSRINLQICYKMP